MGELTTSKTNQKGELTPEQKAKQIENDKKVLESYNVQIDQLNLEIPKLEMALKLKLPQREVKAQIDGLKEELKKFERYKKIIVERNK